MPRHLGRSADASLRDAGEGPPRHDDDQDRQPDERPQQTAGGRPREGSAGDDGDGLEAAHGSSFREPGGSAGPVGSSVPSNARNRSSSVDRDGITAWMAAPRRHELGHERGHRGLRRSRPPSATPRRTGRGHIVRRARWRPDRARGRGCRTPLSRRTSDIASSATTRPLSTMATRSQTRSTFG